MLQQLLSQQYIDNTLPHAILINGPNGSGKLELALWLTNLLLCLKPSSNTDRVFNACGHCKNCLLAKSQSYPDQLTLQQYNTRLGVDEIREASFFLEKTALIGVYKTVLITDAHLMTVAAANALLKTLEEPSEQSLIILLTHDIDMLLPTIVSRCRVLTIRLLVSEVLMNQSFTSHLPDESMDSGFLNLSHLPELSEETTQRDYKQFKKDFLAYLISDETESVFLTGLLENKHALRWLEKVTCNLLRDYYLSNNELAKPLLEKLTPQLINQLYKMIINANMVIKSYTQANEQFIIEQLLINFAQVLHHKV